jgi:hypothetical protein
MANITNARSDKLIDQVILGRYQNHDDFIVNKVFPEVEVDRPTDKYSIMNGDHLRDDDDVLDAMGKANEIEWDYDTPQSYMVGSYGFTQNIPGKFLRTIDEALKRGHRTRAARINVDKLLTNKERRGALQAFSTSVMTGYTTALTTGQYFDDPNSNLFEILGDYIYTVKNRIGRRPNFMGIGGVVWDKGISNHPDFEYKLPDGTTKAATVERFIEVMAQQRIKGLNVYIGDSTYNTAAKGATASWSDIWGNYVLIGYNDPNAQTEDDLTFGKTFIERGKKLKNKFWQAGDEYDEMSEKLKTTVDYQVKVVYPQAGHLLSSVLQSP